VDQIVIWKRPLLAKYIESNVPGTLMSEYALVPDGFKLTKVNKGEKQAVKDHRKHQDTIAFLDNQNTPLLLGVGGLALFTPILWKAFLKIVEDSGEITEEQSLKLALLFPAGQILTGAEKLFPGVIRWDDIKTFFTRTEDDTPTGPPPWGQGFRGGR